jgi:sugar/nucleoside kinase (ribokinase family)
MYDICGVGHITLDKVITPGSEKYMPGGTSYYFSNAIRHMPLNYLLVTSLGDNRTQRVLRKADPFTLDQVKDINATIFHLGPLLADDMSVAFIRELSARAKVSLDVQGFLRTVENKQVVLTDWADKMETLQYIDILKANDQEMEVITGCSDIRQGAALLHKWGVKEVVITLGSKGSVLFIDGSYYYIPVFVPETIADTTGCGDTYMAGYLSQRILGKGPQEAGEFASAIAALKIESHGPFTGTAEDVFSFMKRQPDDAAPVS